MPIFLKLFQKLEEKEHFQIHFTRSAFGLTLTPKPDKDVTKKRKLQANISDKHRHKNLQQHTSKQNPTTH